ncbi:basic helix-loop-helix protein [Tulasnella sp. UAMH 9824]|nr:basic helix-loop-helix protein [Tulasnella sp. UAMH 9824]
MSWAAHPSDPHHLRPLGDLSLYSGQQRSPPRVNSGTRPTNRKSPRKNAHSDNAEGDASPGSGGESSGDESGDDYLPDEQGRDGEEDELIEADEPRHQPHPHYAVPHTHHPHPQGLPPLPPDYGGLAATQSLTTMGSQTQSQQTQPESSFSSVPESFIGAGPGIDPHTGMPLPPDLAGAGGDPSGTQSSGGRGKRGKRHVNDEEWNRQRKDNHKEVERRRRGNINEGINQLAAIVPNSAGGEKAKGAILSRAVTYIHQLKDNEARNIEKWTLEKLLMDQAMGDLQNQLEEYKRRWEIEVQARMALERELEIAKARAGPTTTTSTAAASEENATTGQKRARVE